MEVDSTVRGMEIDTLVLDKALAHSHKKVVAALVDKSGDMRDNCLVVRIHSHLAYSHEWHSRAGRRLEYLMQKRQMLHAEP